MLQYPINVYPDNVAVDKTSSSNDRDVHFTFKGDILKAYVVRFYDYKTGNVAVNDTPIYDYDSTNLVFNNIGYNNDFMSASGLLGSLQTTGSYVMQMMMIEGSVSTGGLNVSRFVLRGKTTAACLSGATTIKIEDKINNIYEWDLNVTNVRSPYTVTEGAVTYDLNVMNIVINGQTIKISSYNYNTGEITLATGVSLALAEGTSYEIYSNYLVTDQYYFNTASMPVLTNLYAAFDSNGIHFTANCNDIVTYYTVKMQKKLKNFNDRYYDVAQTDKIYSQLISCDFVDDYDYDDMGGNSDTRKYRFIVEAKTQNGFYITAISSDFAAPERNTEEVILNPSADLLKSINAIYVQWREPYGIHDWTYRVYRIDAEENYAVNPNKQLIYDNTDNGFTDYGMGIKGSYKYMIVPYIPVASEVELARLEQDIEDIEEEIEENNIDMTQTVFGNIDTDNREYLVWNEENLIRFADAIESWGFTPEELRGSVSTVLGAYGNYDNVDIAFSPILQTNNGAYLLEADVVDDYIMTLIAEAGEGWTDEQLLALDSEGLEMDGMLINSLIADIGETAEYSSEAMHYTGSTGALAQAETAYADAASGEIAEAIITDRFDINEYGYTITAITDTDKKADGKPFYLIGDTYKFMVDIDGTTVTQNLDNVLHVGYGKYSSKTSTNVNYASGTVSAYLGQVYCNGSQVKYEDTIKIVRKWREFITQDCQFILKSQKGDVWLVNIIENPTTEYEEDVAVLPTKFTFSWAECGSIDDILIGKELPPRYEERE